jgi:RNA polymerase sigma factor (sigma-70 family)
LTARLLPEALQFSWRSDNDLVIAVRRGEDSAFEQLFARYRTRIWTYSSRILGDADRAEDVTQEVFISVLRRLRDTERPIAFKPWVYQIAKNACIDELRRTRRTQEVSFDLESDGEDGSELLFRTAPGPDVAIESKQRLEDLQGAFRGVSDLHRRMLVLRELEGLSYGEIGTRLGMSRPVVESTLFRARRRLAEEYEELISGRRCERTRAVIDAWEGRKLRRLGVRETRQVSRHLSHCRPCRRHAVLARGAGAVAHPPAAVVQDRAGVAHPEPVAAVVNQSAGAIVRRAAGALVLRKSAGDLPARPVERPITLASRRRPAAEDAAIAAPGPDSLAVA